MKLIFRFISSELIIFYAAMVLISTIGYGTLYRFAQSEIDLFEAQNKNNNSILLKDLIIVTGDDPFFNRSKEILRVKGTEDSPYNNVHTILTLADGKSLKIARRLHQMYPNKCVVGSDICAPLEDCNNKCANFMKLRLDNKFIGQSLHNAKGKIDAIVMKAGACECLRGSETCGGVEKTFQGRSQFIAQVCSLLNQNNPFGFICFNDIYDFRLALHWQRAIDAVRYQYPGLNFYFIATQAMTTETSDQKNNIAQLADKIDQEIIKILNLNYVDMSEEIGGELAQRVIALPYINENLFKLWEMINNLDTISAPENYNISFLYITTTPLDNVESIKEILPSCLGLHDNGQSVTMQDWITYASACDLPDTSMTELSADDSSDYNEDMIRSFIDSL